jgi:hypothetical protein
MGAIGGPRLILEGRELRVSERLGFNKRENIAPFPKGGKTGICQGIFKKLSSL